MRSISFVVGVLSLLLLTACGGGGDSGPDLEIDGSGHAPKETIYSGPITRIDDESVEINGVAFALKNTQFNIDNQSATANSLKLGHYVTLEGLINEDGTSGTANIVNFDTNVQGPVSAVMPDQNTLKVLGQEVFVNENTVIDDALREVAKQVNTKTAAQNKIQSPEVKLEDISFLSGQAIQVSGTSTGNGPIYATRIERIDESDPFIILGKIKNLDEENKQFMINDQLINYDSVSTIDIVDGELSNNITIKIFSSELTDEGEIAANTISSSSRDSHDSSGTTQNANIYGQITLFISDKEFLLEDFYVTIDENTEYTNGEESDLQQNIVVRVTGSMNDDHIIFAQHVEFVEKTPIVPVLRSLNAKVDNITHFPDDGSYLIEMLGLDIEVRETMPVWNESADPLALSEINVGDQLSMHLSRRYQSSDIQRFSALDINLETEKTDSAIIGEVGLTSLPDNALLSIGSLFIATTPSTIYYIENREVVDQARFLENIEQMQAIRALGNVENSLFIASELSFTLRLSY